MKTNTSPFTGLSLALLFGTALTLPINVAAEIQPVDEAPSETSTPKPTLLLPYFEADPNKGTLFDINNEKGGDKAAPQTPKPPQRKGKKKHRNKTGGAPDQKSALDQRTTETTAQSRYSVGFDAVPPATPPTDPVPEPPQRKGKKHRNKNSELAPDKTNAAPSNHDNVLWGDYFQGPPNPPPKSKKPNQFSDGSGNEEQKGKNHLNNKNPEGSGTFDNRYQENGERKKKKQRRNSPQASSSDWDDQPKKQKKKHHHHDDDQNQGND